MKHTDISKEKCPAWVGFHERFIPGLPDQLEARAINFAAVDFEMSPLVVIALCVPSRESEVRA